MADPERKARLADRLAPAERPTARRSPLLFTFFARYFARFFARHMNALRVARWGEPALPPGAGPIVVYSNHPAWWDAAVYILLAHRYFRAWESYAPIDEAMIRKYGFFARIGGYGVDLESPRGAATFLAASADILSRPNRLVWVASQGRFVDARVRPLGVKAGVARLAELAPDALFVPLALDYAFWLERGGEACVAFGTPIPGRDLLALPRAARLARLEDALTATLDRLSADVMTLDPARFHAVVAGTAGVGGVYDGWKRLVAAARGRSYRAAHADASASEGAAR